MRINLLLAATVSTLAATSAAAQTYPLATGETRPADPVFSSDPPGTYSASEGYSGTPTIPLSERRALRPYREYNWYKPGPGKTGYFADDYHRVWLGAKAATLGNGDRVYRGRDLRYYCRRWDGSTQLLDSGSHALLGDALPAGGSEILRKIAASDPQLAAAIKRRDIRCGGNAQRFTLTL